MGSSSPIFGVNIKKNELPPPKEFTLPVKDFIGFLLAERGMHSTFTQKLFDW